MYNNSENETMKIRKRKGTLSEYTVDFPNKFESIEEATKFANAMKIKFDRLVKKNKWHCFIYIGVSEVDKKDVKIVKVKTNRRGPRNKIYRRKDKDIDIELLRPHIHIYMIGFPGSTIAEEVKKYLSKKIDSDIDVIKVKNIKSKVQLQYIKEQSIIKRIVYRDTDDTIIANKHRRIGIFKETDWL